MRSCTLTTIIAVLVTITITTTLCALIAFLYKKSGNSGKSVTLGNLFFVCSCYIPKFTTIFFSHNTSKTHMCRIFVIIASFEMILMDKFMFCPGNILLYVRFLFCLRFYSIKPEMSRMKQVLTGLFVFTQWGDKKCWRPGNQTKVQHTAMQMFTPRETRLTAMEMLPLSIRGK